MTRESSASNGNSKIEELIDVVCREFELNFRDNPAFRIEDLLDDVPRHLAGFDSDSQRAGAIRMATAELIFVEMDMRRAAGQSFAANEYLDRFPDFGPAIHESLDRQRQLHSDFREDCSVVTVQWDSGYENGEFPPQLDPRRDASVPMELGPYREIVEIKTGGFGIVCRATDNRDGRVVALKFPRKDKLKCDSDLNTFLAEANKAMLLDNPGIVQTHAVEQSDGYLAIVQQFIDGLDLRATKDQPRSHKEIARLVEKVAEALAHAHEQGIYHRDLKPGNILIDRQGRPYIADFGLALNESEQIHLPKQRVGTPHYMPPEQVAGLTRLLDGRSDIWSLGVILYELLTKRRPFEGVTVTDVFDQIENKDPRPPRQIDPAIDRELQRICLKCMERQQRDRYPTADELADDLRHWAVLPDAIIGPNEAPSQMIPKGLRSYSAEDATFFLDLLPGPRDRNGIPGSIRFWKSRICEPVAAENRVPVGVIFGPSGSGKSSFIKAGLLPQLGGDVLTLYVEATQADTEVRLLKSLRQRIGDIPDDISLPELLRGLSHGQWRATTYGKLLIVIDQFEQRLSRGDEFESSQLAKSLRYCDGQQLQCLLLTRDDFMMALSRFADALEMDIREGENAQAIDLFDRKHARKVLARLGRAYEQLPAEPAALSAEQESFLDDAVRQLAEDDHVICVRLALFAEMFRHRPWTTTELKQVGGVAGTGEKFLEATFGPGSRDKRHRMQCEPAQRVLETLLPVGGTDIRGAMKSEQELIAAAQLQNQPGQFDELIKSLASQLKLITRTDPDHPNDFESKNLEAANKKGWYQLTHDYLVPSVRSWLDSTLGMTRAGRARLRLRDLGAQAVPGQPPRNLPTNYEWLAWQFQIPSSSLGDNERLVMRAAGGRFRRQAGIAFVILLLFGAWVAYAAYQNADKQRVANEERRIANVDLLIDDLIHQEVSTTPGIVNQLKEQRSIAESKLKAIVTDGASSPSDKLRASMGLLPFNSDFSPLIDAITSPNCSPEELVAIVEILVQCGFDDSERLYDVLKEPADAPRSRFRALCGLVLLNYEREDLAKFGGLVANVLWDEPLTSVDRWIAIIQPAGKQFLETFETIFAEADDASKSIVMAKALFSILPPGDRMKTLAQYTRSANEAQFDAILSTVEENGAADEFSSTLEELMKDQTDHLAQTNMSIAMMRLGHDKDFQERYSGDFELPSTILAINLSTNRRLRFHSLRQFYVKHNVAKSNDVNLRRSVLQALALQSVDLFDPDLRDWLAGIARRHAETDLDACCFSTSELILSRLKSDSVDQWRGVRRNKSDKDGILGNVLIDNHGRAFSIIEHTDQNGQSAEFAIATTETTNKEVYEIEFDRFVGPFQHPHHPFQLKNFDDFRLVYSYCNWLSVENQLTGKELCDPKDFPSVEPEQTQAELEQTRAELEQTRADFLLACYRIPTVREWTVANESNRVLEGLSANFGPLVRNYAWVFENTTGRVHSVHSVHSVHDVATRLPNAAGLFDSFGNVQEICLSMDGESLQFFEMGQSIRQNALTLSIDKGRWPHEVISPIKTLQGFRLVRRMR